MAIDNKFRVSELVQSGSRAIISEDPISKTHTFVDGSSTIVSQSANEPYEHFEGERDGELTNFIEKPKYDENQLKRAVDTVVDELILPPLPPSPEVVPKPLYDDLLARYNKAIADLAEANNTIRNLQAQISTLQGQIQSLLSQLDAAKVAQSIAENQAQQTNERYSDLLNKFAQAIIKSTKEGIQRVSLNAQVEGLTAQKDTLREQITQLRQLVASLQGQVAAQLDILDTQQDAARQREQAAQDQLDNLKDQQSGQQATNLAVASGFQDMGDGNTYIKWSTGEFSSGNLVVGMKTKCKNYSDNGPGEWKGGETLEIQNLKDTDGINVTGVSITVTSQQGGQWRGTKNWFKPAQQPSIPRGERGSVTLVAESFIHGLQKEKPNQVEPSDALHGTSFGFTSREAKTHTGKFTLKISYSDGTNVSKSFDWKIQKDKD
jgi:hypothetical protein